MSRWNRAALASLLALALLAPTAHGLIKRLIPLRDVIAAEPMIFVARVEKVHPEKPAAILKVTETLKGKVPFATMPVNLAGDDEGKRDKQPPQLLKRIAEDVPLVVFAHKQGDQTLAFAYTNGTWLQLSGRGDSDEKLVWTFNHFEPYFRRTFKGTTDELKQAVIDGLAGKKVPVPDEKEPPGLGPEIKPADKPAGSGGAGTPLAVAPTLVLIGPLAILAALFPTVFGGLAIMMKRWTAALSISSLVSTIYCAPMWFPDALSRTWLGSTNGLWLSLTALSALGAIWAGMRFRQALREADFETFEPRRWDYLALGILSLAGVGGIGFAILNGRNLLQPPWLILIVSCIPVWVATGALLFVRSGPEGTVAFSLEAAFLWGMTFACANVAALERGRGEGSGIQIVADTGRKIPRPHGLAWQFDTGAAGRVYSTPLVAGDRLYFTAVQSFGLEQWGAVFCVDANSGREVWRFDNGRGAKNSVAMKDAFSSSCLADGKLYVGEGFHEHRDCKLFCLDATTGKKLWEFQTTSHTESTPCVVDGKVYFGAGDAGVYCLRATNGQQIWNYPGVHVDASPVVRDGRLYVGSGVGDQYNVTVVFCLDAEKGTEIWKMPVDLPAFAPPALVDNQVFFGIGNGNYSESVADPKGALLCMDAATGRRVWRCDVPDTVLTKPAFDSDAVYFGSRDGHCYCAGRADGRVKWKKQLGSAVVASPILVGDEADLGAVPSLYVAATAGRFACLDPRSGELYWSLELARMAKAPEAHVFATPAVVESRTGGGTLSRRIYVGADVKLLARMYCFEDEVK